MPKGKNVAVWLKSGHPETNLLLSVQLACHWAVARGALRNSAALQRRAAVHLDWEAVQRDRRDLGWCCSCAEHLEWLRIFLSHNGFLRRPRPSVRSPAGWEQIFQDVRGLRERSGATSWAKRTGNRCSFSPASPRPGSAVAAVAVVHQVELLML